jgi:hypothetical protein
MKSNTFFSFNRFYLLLRNDILINYKKYLFTVLGAFIVGYLILFWQMPKVENVYPNFMADNYSQVFYMGLLGLGAFVGMAFPELENKIKTSNYLMLPASAFERMTVQFLIRVIGAGILYLVVFWLDAHLACFSALRIYQGHIDVHRIESFHFSSLFIGTKDLLSKLAIIFAIFSIGMYLFSIRIFFKRFALVKTIISLVAIYALFACVMVVFSHLFYPETIGFRVHIDNYNLTPEITNSNIWVYSISFVSWLFFLPLGYFKLKEKQV